jgi:hypothetical protein
LLSTGVDSGIFHSSLKMRTAIGAVPRITRRDRGVNYLLLIYGEESTQAPSQDEIDQVMGEYWAFEKAVADAGVKVGGAALQPSQTATTVRVKDGERVVTDGPFAETREVLGGYYLLDVPDLDEALEWAGRCPGSKYGSVEVRPVMEFEGLPAQ